MPFPDVSRHVHPVLAAEKLRDRPVRVTVGDRAFALFRDRAGRPAALLDRCPHRFAPLSQGKVRSDGRLACPYHGWNFDREGCGRSPSQPSLKNCDVESFAVHERDGFLWIGPRGSALSSLPEVARPGYDFAGGFSHLFQAPLHVALDNFSEDEHVPWVHNFLGWTESAIMGLEYHAENFADRTEVRYAATQRPSPWTRLLLIKPGDVFHNRWVTKFSPVHTIYDLDWRDPKTDAIRPVRSRVAIFFVPATEKTTWLHSFVFIQLGDPRFRLLLPIIRKAGMFVAWNEVRDDQRFIVNVAQTPFDLSGMRLGRFDKPLVHNHKLLRTIYFGEADSPSEKLPIYGASSERSVPV